jgi:hypothetical protein
MTYRNTALLGFALPLIATLSFIQRMQTEPIKGAFTLTADSPVCMIPFTRDFITRAPIAIQVTVDSISDKNAANFTIKAYIIEDAKDSFFIGSFSSYPIANPGKFLLSLHRYGEVLAGEQKKANTKQLKGMLKFVLVPYAKKPEIRVHIASVAWVVEGPDTKVSSTLTPPPDTPAPAPSHEENKENVYGAAAASPASGLPPHSTPRTAAYDCRDPASSRS